jgi:hypothetical protein
MRNTSNFIVESWDTQKPERGRIKKEVRVLSLMIRFGQECAMVFLKTQHGDTCTQSNQLKLIRNFPGRAAHSITTVPVQHPLRRCVTIIKSIHSTCHLRESKIAKQMKKYVPF